MHYHCEICGQEPATIHVTKVIDGITSEIHYCSTCSKKQIDFPPNKIGNVIISQSPQSSNRLTLVKGIAEKFPDDPVALYGLGDAYMADGQFENAIQIFQKIIQLKPDYTASYRELGKALAKAGKIEEAKEIYKIGIEVSVATGELQTGKEMRVFFNRLVKGQ